MDLLTGLRADRDLLNKRAAANNGDDPTFAAMRFRFRLWRAIRRQTRAEARKADRAMKAVVDPNIRVVKRMPASQRKGRLVQKGGRNNLWRTYPPQT